MPFKLNITNKISEGIYHASGIVVGKKIISGEEISTHADVLVKVENGKAMLHLDSSIHTSTVGGKEVTHFIMQETVEVSEKNLKKGAELEFNNVNFNLNK